MDAALNKFYKSQGYWWTVKDHSYMKDQVEANGPFCINCVHELIFPETAYDESDPIMSGKHWIKPDWQGVIFCPNCGKEFEMLKTYSELKEKVVLDFVLRKRANAPKVSLDDLPTQVKVRDEDDKYFISAKIGEDKQGRRVGVVYFGEKVKKQEKKDYAQIFVDFENQVIRQDAKNKLPKDILARLTVEFLEVTTISNFKRKSK